MNNEQFLKTIAKQYVAEVGERHITENAALAVMPTPALDAKVKAARRRAFFARSRILVSVAASIAVAAIVWFGLLPANSPEIVHNYSTLATPQAGMPAAALPPVEEAAPGAAPPVATGWAMPDHQHAAQMPWNEREERNMDFYFRQMPELGGGIVEEDSLEVRAGVADSELSPEFGLFGAPAMPNLPPERGEDYGMGPEASRDVQEIELWYFTPPQGWVMVEQSNNAAIFHRQDDENTVVRAIVSTTPLRHDLYSFTPIIIFDTTVYLLAGDGHSILIYYYDELRFTLTTTADYLYLFEFVTYKLGS